MTLQEAYEQLQTAPDSAERTSLLRTWCLDRDDPIAYFLWCACLHRWYDDYYFCFIAETLFEIPQDQGLGYYNELMLLDFDLAEDHYQALILHKVGDYYREAGLREFALEALSQAAEHQRVVTDVNPEFPDQRRFLTVLLNKTGDIYFEFSRFADALENYSSSLEIATALTQEEPDTELWRWDVSVCHSKQGAVYEKQERYSQALEHFRTSLKIAEDICEGAELNPEWMSALCVCYERLAHLHRKMGERQEALKYFEEDYEIAEELREMDEDNPQWEWKVSISLNNLGDVCREMGNRQRAFEHYEEALEIRERLSEAEKDNMGWRWSLCVSLWRIAEGYEHKPGCEKKAKDSWQRLLDTLETIEAPGLQEKIEKVWKPFAKDRIKKLNEKLGEVNVDEHGIPEDDGPMEVSF